MKYAMKVQTFFSKMISYYINVTNITVRIVTKLRAER